LSDAISVTSKHLTTNATSYLKMGHQFKMVQATFRSQSAIVSDAFSNVPKCLT